MKWPVVRSQIYLLIHLGDYFEIIILFVEMELSREDPHVDQELRLLHS